MLKWISRLVAAVGLTAFLCAGAPVTDRLGLNQMVAQMSWDGVRITYEWKDCGTVNAYYMQDGTILMCNELLPAMSPGMVRYVFAHEAAHAIIDQRQIPFTGLEEAAADEFAAWVLGITGRERDIKEAAEYWSLHETPDNAWDPHPSSARRAAMMQCLYWGITDQTAMRCVLEWRRVVRAWGRLMNVNK